ncbi:MAG: hypothetical protein K2Q12_00715 [Rickettsiales bacterium]|nr:hypothetical protein [Rickettsiales bacterium]
MLFCSPATLHAEDIFTRKPDCPLPADLEGSEGVEYQAKNQTGVAADLTASPPVNIDIPLGIPLPQLSQQASDLSLSQVPVGELSIRDGKTDSLKILGQTPQAQSTQLPLDCVPRHH